VTRFCDAALSVAAHADAPTCAARDQSEEARREWTLTLPSPARHAGEGIEKQRKEEKSGGASVREEVSALDR
jgi:hypothetical protein